MVPGSIQMSGETLSGAEVQGVCEGLAGGSVRLLSLRGCRLSDRDFGRLCQGLAASPSLVQLNLNLGLVSNATRAQHLAQGLQGNRSLHSLLLHGNPLTDAGLSLLSPALAAHPALVSLDLGDCLLGDEGIRLICGLLPPDGAKPGLRDLTLSANPAVSFAGWSRLAIAVAHSSQLRSLNLDYNPLGDGIASMLAVCVACSRSLEVLDLEGAGLSNQSAQILLDMVQNYPTPLRSLVLSENKISAELQRRIADLLSEGEEDEDSEDQKPPTRERGLKSDPGPRRVLLTSGLGDSLLAETEM